jgi:hypothetical protein
MNLEEMSWQTLGDYCVGRGPQQHSAAIIEAQRRAVSEQGESTNVQKDLIAAIHSSGDCAARQTEEVIRLTTALKTLTWAWAGLLANQ